MAKPSDRAKPSTSITVTSAERQHREHPAHAVRPRELEAARQRRPGGEVREDARQRERAVRELTAPEIADDGRSWLGVGVAPEQRAVRGGREGGQHDGAGGDDERHDVHAAPSWRSRRSCRRHIAER